MTANSRKIPRFRPGKKVQGKPANIYEEKKQRIELSLTPTAISTLKLWGELIEGSRSEVIEILARHPEKIEQILIGAKPDQDFSLSENYPLTIQMLAKQYNYNISTIARQLRETGRFKPDCCDSEYEGIKPGASPKAAWKLRKIR